MPVRIPVIEMIEIGAGGGSIANVDRLGRLCVGPQSAGSEPGPAAFGRGGNAATVTDADVVLGLVDPDQFAEGRLPIDVSAAEAVLVKDVGSKLQVDAEGAALGICEIVDESMASAGRMHAVESGKDLGERTMIAFGGNGPLHATRVARRAGVRRILVPPDPGVGSAVGFLFAPVSFEIVRSRYTLLAQLDLKNINGLLEEMISDAETVVRAGAPDSRPVRKRSAFMRYHGQGHEIEVALPDRELIQDDVDQLVQDFEAGYSHQFSRAVPGMAIEILNWSVNVSTQADIPSSSSVSVKSKTAKPGKTRTIHCEITGARTDAAEFNRAALVPGDQIDGPALVVEPQTTTYISNGYSAQIDNHLNLVITQIDQIGGVS